MNDHSAESSAAAASDALRFPLSAGSEATGPKGSMRPLRGPSNADAGGSGLSGCSWASRSLMALDDGTALLLLDAAGGAQCWW